MSLASGKTWLIRPRRSSGRTWCPEVYAAALSPRRGVCTRARGVVHCAGQRRRRFLAHPGLGDAGMIPCTRSRCNAAWMCCGCEKPAYGRELRLWFGIDKRAVAHGPAAIDAELALGAAAGRRGRLCPRSRSQHAAGRAVCQLLLLYGAVAGGPVSSSYSWILLLLHLTDSGFTIQDLSFRDHRCLTKDYSQQKGWRPSLGKDAILNPKS